MLRGVTVCQKRSRKVKVCVRSKRKKRGINRGREIVKESRVERGRCVCVFVYMCVCFSVSVCVHVCVCV